VIRKRPKSGNYETNFLAIFNNTNYSVLTTTKRFLGYIYWDLARQCVVSLVESLSFLYEKTSIVGKKKYPSVRMENKL